MTLSYDQAQSEVEIEKALLGQLQGEVSVEDVQDVMNESLNTKYKA
jgi:hypothetical protein